MRVPQVSERIKEAPAQALRGVFAGIGQLLLITDKLRNKPPVGQQVPQARAPQPSETVSPAAPVPAADPPAPAPAAAAAPAPAGAAPAPAAPPAPAADRDFDKTGNVRLLTSAEAPAGDTAPAVRATVAEAAPVSPVAPTAPGAPLPNYDELSVASLRARLRNLDVAQLRRLAEYESAHAGRADVIAMFERRIAKLQAETSPQERGEAAAEAGIEAREAVEAEVQDEIGAEAEGEE
jgi:hypothetical protein